MPGQITLISVLGRNYFLSAGTHRQAGNLKSSPFSRAMGAASGRDASIRRRRYAVPSAARPPVPSLCPWGTRCPETDFLPAQFSLSPTYLPCGVTLNRDDYGKKESITRRVRYNEMLDLHFHFPARKRASSQIE
jgi:hypothetical protein